MLAVSVKSEVLTKVWNILILPSVPDGPIGSSCLQCWFIPRSERGRNGS